jgi:hypothetical protein
LHQLLGQLQGVPQAQSWRTLGDVYRTLHSNSQQQPHSMALAALLQLIISILPHPWREQILLPQPPPCPWECTALPGDKYIARHNTGTGLHFFWAISSGLLLPMPAQDEGPLGTVLIPPDAQWVPACVYSLPKPDFRLTHTEYQQQQLPPAQRPEWPEEYWLQGAWSDVCLDPSVWGWGGTGPNNSKPVTMLKYTVKAARSRLAALTYAVMHPQLYSQDLGVWPRLWGQRPVRPQPGQPPTPLDTTGLQQFEQLMVDSFDRVSAAHLQQQQHEQGLVPPDEVDRVVPWLDVAHRPPPRMHASARAARNAARQAASQQQEPQHTAHVPHQAVLHTLRHVPAPSDMHDIAALLSQPQRMPCGAWHTLTDHTMHRDHVAAAWRVLHGALLVGGN